MSRAARRRCPARAAAVSRLARGARRTMLRPCFRKAWGFRYERLRPALRSLGKRGIRPRAPGAVDRGHAAPDRRKESARPFDADRPPRQVRLSAKPRRAAPGRTADAGQRDLPHLFDDQTDRLGRRDDARRGGAAVAHRSGVGLHPRFRRGQSRRPERRSARACASQAARDDSGPHAPHFGSHLRIHRRIACPETDQGRRPPEPQSFDSGDRRGDRRPATHASAGRRVGIWLLDRRAWTDRRDRRGRSSERRVARASVRAARHDRHSVLHARIQTRAARRPVLVRLHESCGRRSGEYDRAAQVRVWPAGASCRRWPTMRASSPC